MSKIVKKIDYLKIVYFRAFAFIQNSQLYVISLFVPFYQRLMDSLDLCIKNHWSLTIFLCQWNITVIGTINPTVKAENWMKWFFLVQHMKLSNSTRLTVLWWIADTTKQQQQHLLWVTWMIWNGQACSALLNKRSQTKSQF